LIRSNDSLITFKSLPVTFRAEDLDSGEFGEFDFSLTGGNDDDVFGIDPDSGTLFCNVDNMKEFGEATWSLEVIN